MMRPSLPTKRNPFVQPGAGPDYEELLSRRRLGQTKLTVKPAQVGTSNATKPENLGVFEYAHLRAPLPKDLKGSEIFAPHLNQPHPETYFLMRRSKDGFISATGMFKIAFPWALQAEERAEREYLKIKESASQDEVAGNVWISPGLALELAEEYGMSNWVRALLDPSSIIQSPATSKKHISPPPNYEQFPGRPILQPSSSSSKISNARSTRSASPSKIASPVKKSAAAPTPRKRQTKASKEANLATANAANAALQSALDDAVSTAEQDSVSGDAVKVEFESSVDVHDDVQTTKTNVSVEMPVGSADLPLPQKPEEMVETAKKMVEEANAIENAPPRKSSNKRKAKELDAEEPESVPAQPNKKAKVLEETLKKEKVRSRALIGVTATLAIAAAIPYFF